LHLTFIGSALTLVTAFPVSFSNHSLLST
jgi:hypothetical protein